VKELKKHYDVEADMLEGALWYERRQERLGDRFVAEVEGAYRHIQANPEIWKVYRNGIRRYVMRVFPFSVYFRVEGDAIVIFAVAHSKRRPSYWMHRVGQKAE
jgi:toxin ParE1/3/4